VVQIPFFWNIVQTLRGKVAAPSTARRDWPLAAAEGTIMLIVLGLIAAGGVVGWVIGHNTAHRATRTVTVAASTPATTGPATTGASDLTADKQVFASAGCGSCHTLKAAGANGTIGPNLDQKKHPLTLVLQRVSNGKGAMPAFKAQLTPQQIKDVAAFVVASTGG
jgi:mono/diheme cytochrome c family protein